MANGTETIQVPFSKVESAKQAGYKLNELAGQTDADRYAKDKSYSGRTLQTMLGPVSAGAAKSVVQIPNTLASWLDSIAAKYEPEAEAREGGHYDFRPGDASRKLKSAEESLAPGLSEPIRGPGEHAGGFLETLGEWLYGEGEAKTTFQALTKSEQLAKLAKAAKFIEEHPAVAASLRAAATGAGAGTQSLAHGATPREAAVAAAVGGGASALGEGAMAAGKRFIPSRAPVTETIAGEEVPALSSQQPGTGPRGDVKAGEVPKFAAKQQAAAPRVFRNVAQRATRQALDEANQGRAIAGQITDPARMLPAPADAEPYKFTIPGTAAAEGTTGEIAQPAAKRAQAAFKQPSFVTSSAEAPTVAGVEGSTGADVATSTPRQAAADVATGGGTLTTDAHTAQMHLSRLNELVDHPPAGMKPEQLQAITEARDNLQEQMDMYNAHQRMLPNFAPVDAARTAASVGHFGEAEDQLQQAAQPIYQKIDQATNGEFDKLNRARTAAAKRGDFTAKYEIEDKLDQLITDSGAISPAERQQATKLWATSKVLGAFDDVINNAANVNDRYASQVAGGRTLSGTKLQNGLQGMIQRYGTERLESVIGKDGMENMTRMADLLKTQPQSKIQALSMNLYHNLAHGKVGAAIGIGLGQHLGGYEGATAGAIVGANAERAVLRYLATNPRAGQLFDYAVRNDVTPKLAAGLIAAEIQREHAEPEEDKEQ